MRLDPLRYKYRDDAPVEENAGRVMTGFIAEDLVKQFPEMVRLDSLGRPDAIYYADLIAILVSAVQTQQQDIKALKEKMN